MTSPIADGVMAATHKLVQQAMQGQWNEVPRTVEQRRELLNQLTASASPSDQQWLSALKQAMTESDAAVAKMAAVDAVSIDPAPAAPSAEVNGTQSALDRMGSTMEMLARRR